MKLFDSHCHLQDSRLLPAIDEVLKRAADAGVCRMLCCGAAENDWNDVLKLAQRSPSIVSALGLHPSYLAEKSPQWLQNLRKMLKESGAVVGEIGLDHSYEPRDEKDQEEVFLAQLALASELGRPASIHCRQAWGRMVEVLKSAKLPERLVLHSYSGSAELVQPLTERGAYFSFSGSITFSGNKRGHKSMLAVPWDRLLIETDAPDLMPIIREGGSAEKRQGPNEPANLVYVARKIAELRGVTVEEVAERTWENACRIFGEGKGGGN